MTDLSPANALDPNVILAMNVQAQPGVFAALLGSGVSRPAQIPTGWEITKDLVGRLAGATNTSDRQAAAIASDDPDAWWGEHGDGQPLGYSNLLSASGPTAAARRALISGYFEVTDADTDPGAKQPTAAHRSIAELVKSGSIRVVITTNFDRLLEQALHDTGINPQVLSSPDAAVRRTPLAHSPATIIKINGDYTDLDMRNTADELCAYPEPWNDLLTEVFTNYGLIIAGWSADWDAALADALEKNAPRRYPLFWDRRSGKGDRATSILAAQHGVVLPVDDADELFTGLHERVNALNKLSEPPITTAIAVQRLKAYLPDPQRRIDLHDLVMAATEKVIITINEVPHLIPNLTGVEYQEVCAKLLAATGPLLSLVITGVTHDKEGDHTDLWVEVVQRLMRAATPAVGQHQPSLENLQRYPALLVLRAASMTAMERRREQLMIDLSRRPTVRDRLFNGPDLVPATYALADFRVLHHDLINEMPRWITADQAQSKWLWATSHLLRADLRDCLRMVIPDDEEYKRASSAYEYRAALLQSLDPTPGAQPVPGEFLSEYQWARDGVSATEAEFQRSVTLAQGDSTWWPLIGPANMVDPHLERLREQLKPFMRYA